MSPVLWGNGTIRKRMVNDVDRNCHSKHTYLNGEPLTEAVEMQYALTKLVNHTWFLSNWLNVLIASGI